MTASECAARAGVSVQQWSRMEADEPKRKDGSLPVPTRPTVERVASILGLSLGEALLYAAGDYNKLVLEDRPSPSQVDYEPAEDEAELLSFYRGIPPNLKPAVKASLKAIHDEIRRQQEGQVFGRRPPLTPHPPAPSPLAGEGEFPISALSQAKEGEIQVSPLPDLEEGARVKAIQNPEEEA